jgi:hypothetical protein
MRDPIEKYLENVLCHADLAPADEQNVRAELSEHLHALREPGNSATPTEVYTMLKTQFGNPKIVGRAIAAAKGRMRTYFKKKLHKLPLRLGIALILAFAVRYAVAQEFYITGNAVAPVIPLGSRVFVYKLAKSFNPGDIVVYQLASGQNRVGSILRQTPTGDWLVERNNGLTKEVQTIPHQNIVGRVFLNTR